MNVIKYPNLPAVPARSPARSFALLPLSLAALALAVALSLAHSRALFAAEAPAAAVKPARVLLVTGLDYPGHLWRQTAPVLADALRKDARLDVRTVEDPNFLDSAALAAYDAVILHFQTWEQPGPGERARANLLQFVQGGKGVLLLHFASGAWHDEWPDFVKVAGRVWAGPGPNVRQHDPYGAFNVEITQPDHPIMRGLSEFETHDELYTCLIGDVPIQVLAQAKSKVDGKYYPMAFISTCGKGRTFHTPLGHDAKALAVPAVQELLRRGCAWAAGLPPVPDTAAPK